MQNRHNINEEFCEDYRAEVIACLLHMSYGHEKCKKINMQKNFVQQKKMKFIIHQVLLINQKV